uniref:ORF53 n=1 Tax=Nitrosopumilaceae spindle-shaped virus TaxID=3065433 RepID=A0AAT9JHU9_9VIRU
MCDKCVWNHNNHKDRENPFHCTCKCHFGWSSGK